MWVYKIANPIEQNLICNWWAASKWYIPSHSHGFCPARPANKPAGHLKPTTVFIVFIIFEEKNQLGAENTTPQRISEDDFLPVPGVLANDGDTAIALDFQATLKQHTPNDLEFVFNNMSISNTFKMICVLFDVVPTCSNMFQQFFLSFWMFLSHLNLQSVSSRCCLQGMGSWTWRSCELGTLGEWFSCSKFTERHAIFTFFGLLRFSEIPPKKRNDCTCYELKLCFAIFELVWR